MSDASLTEHQQKMISVMSASPALSDYRVKRCMDLVQQAHDLVAEAEDRYCRGYRLRGKVLLFSGGNDSTNVAHLFREQATHAVHANTGIGIEQTRQFVRDQCHRWGIPLLEKHCRPGRGYRELVLGQVDDLRRGHKGEKIEFRGFPGPAWHGTMYAFLKERAIDAAKRDLMSRPREERVIFLSGVRQAESSRRSKKMTQPIEVVGSALWVKPILKWTSADMNTYRALFSVPRNEVADLLHMSGECLCGAFAHPGELEEIEMWFPEVVRWIRDLEMEAAGLGTIEPRRCKWGQGAGKEPPSAVGRMCSSCEFRYQQPSLFDNEPAEVLA